MKAVKKGNALEDIKKEQLKRRVFTLELKAEVVRRHSSNANVLQQQSTRPTMNIPNSRQQQPICSAEKTSGLNPQWKVDKITGGLWTLVVDRGLASNFLRAVMRVSAVCCGSPRSRTANLRSTAGG